MLTDMYIYDQVKCAKSNEIIFFYNLLEL